ncbi:hypothetical protein KIN20_013537 [Parelaphostrongylus tenuis]|uniref:Uncharacterized protein n=1 Tax=Parelaphostrongylus tenuis TaxID=148309 RepID=A0AAD5MDQ7_PARTN|nr:hypothetical protein KIN20_013537 [Parelaphostrongylus tenuis]
MSCGTPQQGYPRGRKGTGSTRILRRSSRRRKTRSNSSAYHRQFPCFDSAGSEIQCVRYVAQGDSSIYTYWIGPYPFVKIIDCKAMKETFV